MASKIASNSSRVFATKTFFLCGNLQFQYATLFEGLMMTGKSKGSSRFLWFSYVQVVVFGNEKPCSSQT